MASLSRRMTAITIIFLIIFAVATALAVYSILQVRTPVEQLGVSLAESVEGSEHFISDLNRADSEARLYALTGDEDEAEEAQELLEAAQEQLAALSVLTPPASLSDEQRAARSELMGARVKLLAQLESQISSIIAAYDSGDEAEAEELLEAIEGNEAQYEELHEQGEEVVDAEVVATTTDIDGLLNNAAGGVVTALVLVLLLVGAILYGLRRNVIQPIAQMAQTAQLVAAGDTSQRMEVSGDAEIAQLQTAFNTMLDSLRQQQDALAEQNRSLEATLAQQKTMVETIQQLGAPLLPITSDTLVLPLVGYLDKQRMEQIARVLLQGISERHARRAIIDLTGLSALNEEVVRHLLTMLDAVRLLGARPIIAGVTGEMATLLVEQEVSLTGVESYGSLEQAMSTLHGYIWHETA